jgi:single-stranded DNA-specific DHH superfamily exonuclease
MKKKSNEPKMININRRPHCNNIKFFLKRLIEELQLNFSNISIEATNMRESSKSFENKLNELLKSSQRKQSEMEEELVKKVKQFLI